MGYKVHILKFTEDSNCPLVHQIKAGAVTVHGRKASDKNNAIENGDKVLFQVLENGTNTSILEVRILAVKQYGDVDEFIHAEELNAILGDRTKCMNIKSESDYVDYYSNFVDTKEILGLKQKQGFGFLGFHIEFIREYQMLTKNVQEPWFSYIKNGQKKVEGRLNKSWVKTVQKLDRITWTYEEAHFSTYIVDLKQYSSFRQMLEKEGVHNVLPGIDSVDQGVEVYRQFYSEEDEKVFGVIGIHLRLL
jgi:ASC-1-like (ASCH) protein